MPLDEVVGNCSGQLLPCFASSVKVCIYPHDLRAADVRNGNVDFVMASMMSTPLMGLTHRRMQQSC